MNYKNINNNHFKFKRMKKLYVLILIGAVSMFSSCFKDLDTIPLDPTRITSASVFNDEAVYKQFLAKLYAGLALTGQEGPAGDGDISGIDEGFSHYLRGYWYHQQLTTDEAVVGWLDQTIRDFHELDWTESDGFSYAFYSRIFYQVSICNEFLRETTNAKLDSRNVSEPVRNEIKTYRAEARFLRALSYWHALDLFRNVPFVTENDFVGAFFPDQTNANDLFKYIESELLAIENEVAAPRSNEYARADRAAVWMLLSKLYLNAEVYIGQSKYTECLTFCEKIINSGFTLQPQYAHLFLADNHLSNEVIFPIAFDGLRTRTWGGMTFIIRAGIGGTINPLESGVSGGWGGTRATRQFIEKFPTNLTGVVVDFNPGGNFPKIYIPGTLNNFNGTDDKNVLSQKIPGSRIYEGYRYFPEDNMEFVILGNPSSTLSGKLGDNDKDGKLENGGANIVVPTKGFYYIRVNLNSGVNTYLLERQDWSIAGDAVPNGETDMVWDVNENKLSVNLELNAGNFKFRGNKDDMNTLGDNQLDGILEKNVGSINIEKSGSYKILLDLTRPDYTYKLTLTSFDKRGIFGTKGQNIDILDIGLFTDGYAVLKFKNITSQGIPGSNVDFPDTDFPMFRLADAYLMAAEAILRGASGASTTKATEYFNVVRTRAYTGTSGNISASELNLDLILDERAREFYWECHRRTDLVRFNKLTTSDYLWAWKGGVIGGTSVNPKFNIFPIPAADIAANPKLKQNPGY